MDSTAPAPLIPARLAFAADGTPYSADYDDVYHSSDGGLGQARHVFLAGNGLLGESARWRGRERFVIVETGFGLGLNFLATWQAWRDADVAQRCARLHFISFEKHPFQRVDLTVLQGRWPKLADFAAALQAQWPTLLPGAHRLHFDDERVVLTLFFGDAIDMLPKLRGKADAFFLDGFAPGKNPQLWSPRIYSNLARLASTGTTLATWTVAGKVRKELSAAGFLLEKTAGFGGKREMTRGAFRIARPAAQLPQKRSALIVGAGLAGCAVAERLAARGWEIVLIDRAAGPAEGASGNRLGILRPLPSIDDNLLARLTRAGYLHARRHLQMLDAEGLPLRWDACGVLHLARDSMHEASQRQIVDTLQPPADYLRHVDRNEAGRLANWPLDKGGWWFPGGGWINPPSLCHANLARFDNRIHRIFGREVAGIERVADEWQTFDAAGKLIASAPLLILANAGDARRLLKQGASLDLPLRDARGQVSHLPAEALAAPDIVICRLGYVTPLVDGLRCAGATFIADDTGEELRIEEHRDNLARLEFSLPGSTANIAADSLDGRVGFRSMTQDRLPVIGPLPANQPETSLEDIPRQPGLYGILGFGARGLVWASLAAELLAAQIEGEPLPLEADLVAAVDPARFMLRRARHRTDGPQSLSAD
jgi:tRNA 5-methylaminomethyl-2-thiouridine biosynthesis bifunctional protein